MYVIPVYHLNIGIQGPININISLHGKYAIIMIIWLIINYLFFYDYSIHYYTRKFIRVNSNARSMLACWHRHANDFATLRVQH